MALKQLLLRARMGALKGELEELRKKDAGFATRKADLEKREAELETAINELTADTGEDDRKTVDDAVAALETDQQALAAEQGDNDAAKKKIEDEIRELETQLKDVEDRSKPTPAGKTTPGNENRKDENHMFDKRKFFATMEQRDAFFAREDVKEFLTRVRDIGAQNRAATGAELGIPTVMLDIVRDNINRYSKLISRVRLKPVKGKARQNVVGTVPEAIWTEMIGALNEVALSFTQIEADGYKVGAYIPIPNSYLADDDNIGLGMEIMDLLGQSLGYGIDKAGVYGSGSKTLVGIATRLAETSQPSYWGTNQGTWTDLSSSNRKVINIDGTTGAAFYAALVAELGIADPKYSDGQAFWLVNRATHIKLMAKALAFDAAAALVAGINNQMPIVGGEIVELDFIPDNEIIGGFGQLYLLIEREGTTVQASDIPLFLQDQTVFKAVARYDGKPIRGEGFVHVSFDNSAIAAKPALATDYTNTALGALAVTSVAGTASGDSLVTVAGAESSGTTLGYKLAGKAADVKCGDKNTGYTTLTSPAQVTGATGKVITVVEFDGNGRAVKVGSAQFVAKP